MQLFCHLYLTFSLVYSSWSVSSEFWHWNYLVESSAWALLPNPFVWPHHNQALCSSSGDLPHSSQLCCTHQPVPITLQPSLVVELEGQPSPLPLWLRQVSQGSQEDCFYPSVCHHCSKKAPHLIQHDSFPDSSIESFQLHFLLNSTFSVSMFGHR